MKIDLADEVVVCMLQAHAIGHQTGLSKNTQNTGLIDRCGVCIQGAHCGGPREGEFLACGDIQHIGLSAHLKLIGVLNVGRVHTLKNQTTLEVIACINKAHFIRCESQRTCCFSSLGLSNHRSLQAGGILNIQ